MACEECGRYRTRLAAANARNVAMERKLVEMGHEIEVLTSKERSTVDAFGKLVDEYAAAAAELDRLNGFAVYSARADAWSKVRGFMEEV